jgi:iron-sulfur cluster assembly accessory protein
MSEPSITLTKPAIIAAQKRIASAGVNAYMRVGVKGAGCSGFQYSLTFPRLPPTTKDITFDFDTVRVVIDERSMKFLNNATIDYKKSLLEEGFTFENPNVDKKCGCGKSFDIKQKDT